MAFLYGILAGFVMPLQTSINTRLRRSLGTPFRASGVNFFVGLCFLIVLSFILGGGLPFGELRGLPLWMYLGGFCGVTVLTGNLLLFPILGATQTIVFPLFGQIVMGILIDTFGWFRGDVVPLTEGGHHPYAGRTLGGPPLRRGLRHPRCRADRHQRTARRVP